MTATTFADQWNRATKESRDGAMDELHAQGVAVSAEEWHDIEAGISDRIGSLLNGTDGVLDALMKRAGFWERLGWSVADDWISVNRLGHFDDDE